MSPGSPGSAGVAGRGPPADRGAGPRPGAEPGVGGPRTRPESPGPDDGEGSGPVEPPDTGVPPDPVPGRGGSFGAGGPPGQGRMTRALEATRSATAGSAVGASLGWFQTVPPTTNVLPPPPSRLAAWAMVRPAEEGWRPSATTNHTSPAPFQPTSVRGWTAFTTLGSSGHGRAGCPPWRTTGVVPMLSVASTGVSTATLPWEDATPCCTRAQRLLS